MILGKYQYKRAGGVLYDKEETRELFEGEPRLGIVVVLTELIQTRTAMAIRLIAPEPLMGLGGLSLLLDWRAFMLEEGKTRIYELLRVAVSWKCSFCYSAAFPYCGGM